MREAVPIRGAFLFSYRDPSSRRRDWDYYVPNGVTVEGLNYLLDAHFGGATVQPLWYMGLIDNSGFSGLAASDTHAAHPGWGEYTSLFLSNRPQWNVATAANSGILASSTPSVFQITSAGTVRGALIASRQAVGAGAGAVLYAAGAMSAGMSVSAGGTISVTYSTQVRN
jgi:hypothetical protein